jgi:hypothetical protein
MNKLLLIFVLTLAFSSIATSQTKNNDSISTQIKSLKAEKILVLDYDNLSNVTQIMAFGGDFGRDQNRNNKLSKFSFGMKFIYVGKTLTNSPQSFITTFWAEGKKAGFANSHALTITVDGENLELGDARYATKSGDDREFLNFNFPREVLAKIVNGKNVQMKMGNANFKFTPEHLKLFAGLLAISSPDN